MVLAIQAVQSPKVAAWREWHEVHRRQQTAAYLRLLEAAFVELFPPPRGAGLQYDVADDAAGERVAHLPVIPERLMGLREKLGLLRSHWPLSQLVGPEVLMALESVEEGLAVPRPWARPYALSGVRWFQLTVEFTATAQGFRSACRALKDRLTGQPLTANELIELAFVRPELLARGRLLSLAGVTSRPFPVLGLGQQASPELVLLDPSVRVPMEIFLVPVASHVLV